jgi:hypothetical protein
MRIKKMKKIYFYLSSAVVLAQSDPPSQPERWPSINSPTYQYSATKSWFEAAAVGHGSSEFIQFYSRLNPENGENDQVMSMRVNGIYSTAYWDRNNGKAHFLYDKYSCDSITLPNPPSGKPTSSRVLNSRWC